MGEALVKAYKLEDKEAKFPRIIIDKCIDGIIRKEDTIFRKDEDDFYFIDFLSYKFSGDKDYMPQFVESLIKNYTKMIKDEIGKCRDKIKVAEVTENAGELSLLRSLLEKYQWLAGKYCNSFFEMNPCYLHFKIDCSYLND